MVQILSYLKKLGNFPMLENRSFNETSFNLTSIVHKDPLALEFFTNYYVARCQDPNNNDREIVCLKLGVEKDYGNKRLHFIHELLSKNLNLSETEINSALRDFQQYLFSQKLLRKQQSGKKFRLTRIETLQNLLKKYTKLNIDWQYMFNNFLMVNSQVHPRSQVLIENPKMFLKSLELLMKMPSIIAANAMTIQFLYGHQHMFEVYPYERSFSTNGKRKDLQRYEQCLQILQTFMAPAMHSMYAKKYFQRNIQESAENLAADAIFDVYHEVQFNLQIDADRKIELLNRLKAIKIVAGFPRFTMREIEIEEFYHELDTNGSDELVDNYIKIITFNRKIHNEPFYSWKRRKENLVAHTRIKYVSSTNTLCEFSPTLVS